MKGNLNFGAWGTERHDPTPKTPSGKQRIDSSDKKNALNFTAEIT
jgi:hypothetical protein